MAENRIKSVRKNPPANKNYCRKCSEMKPKSAFHGAVDSYLDTNGLMSICKECCDEVFQSQYSATKDFRKALLNTCRILNIAYVDDAVVSAENRISSHLEKGKTVNTANIVGYYKQALAGASNMLGNRISLLIFREPTTKIEPSQLEYIDGEHKKAIEEYQYEWGKGYSLEEYEWLERRALDWKKAYATDTPAEKSLLREIIFKEFEIRRAREAGDTYDTLSKEYQSLMKTANLSPSQSNASNSGKNMETFGNFIKQIEEKEPAEVFGEEREAFKDWQNIDYYFEKYIVRPLKNFVQGSKDFNVDASPSDEEDFEDEDLLESLSGELDNEDD